MKLIVGLIDRLLFAAALVVGLQLPGFVEQYTQSVSAAHEQTAETLRVDDERRARNAAPGHELQMAVLEASARQQLETQVRWQRDALAVLNRASLPEKIWHLAFRIDEPTMQTIIHGTVPALTLTPDALLCGLGMALLVWLLFQLLRGIGGLLLARRRRLGYTAPGAPTRKPKPAPEPRSAPVVRASKSAPPARREPRAL